MFWYNSSRWFGGFLMLLVFGCVEPEDVTTFDTDLISLPAVVDSVFNNGMDSLLNVTKTITVNDHPPESKKLVNYNIKEDLRILIDYNVATPRWADFMEVQRTDSAGLQLIRYTTDNKKAPVRNIRVVKKGNDIIAVKIRSNKKNLISEQAHTIVWNLGKSYSIQKTSKLLIRKPSIFRSVVSY
ncbi:hypothetical protein KUV50_17690 [Membranicola marinus]|uniref:Uncharacterized protein n=1 Tax=Membranihabitans marinus TaxID=1227546 RepID=A0A953HY91_9BACT|nr:hypothetical protein [Membranihabitans marinus]MBY5959988.1 hypothetical protein [Membranihabitans marinus]